MEILAYDFFQNALLGSLLASIACAITGTYVVTRRLVFISGGVTHAAFGGVGLGMFLGVSPIASAMLFAVASALGVEWMGRDRRVREDSAIALFWIVGMSLGIIFSFLTPGYSSQLSTYLFGNILTVSSTDIMILSLVALLSAAVLFFMHRAIVSVAFDREFAASRGVPVVLIECIMMALTAVTIVATLRLVGVVLVISMLTVPVMTAMLFARSYLTIILWAVPIGFGASLLGLYLSYIANIPSGATIVLCSVAIYALCRCLRRMLSATQ